MFELTTRYFDSGFELFIQPPPNYTIIIHASRELILIERSENAIKKSTYLRIENYMLFCMRDSAHDKEHIYRVLYLALDVAKYETNINTDVLITACLLHDIGRGQQFENSKLCHAMIGGEMAYDFLIENDWLNEDAEHVKNCIITHRYRVDNSPACIEAKILFDADKLDATGTLGIARSFLFEGQVSEPLYTLDDDGNVLDGTGNENPSFFRECNFKLKKLYDLFYTKRAKEIANERQKSAVSFYEKDYLKLRSQAIKTTVSYTHLTLPTIYSV